MKTKEQYIKDFLSISVRSEKTILHKIYRDHLRPKYNVLNFYLLQHSTPLSLLQKKILAAFATRSQSDLQTDNTNQHWMWGKQKGCSVTIFVKDLGSVSINLYGTLSIKQSRS